jgi:hypothetical protein
MNPMMTHDHNLSDNAFLSACAFPFLPNTRLFYVCHLYFFARVLPIWAHNNPLQCATTTTVHPLQCVQPPQFICG